MGTPLADRNLITFSLNAGFTFHGPFPGRGGDVLGVGMGYGRVSGTAAAFDQQTAFFWVVLRRFGLVKHLSS